ncbi:beta-N-acetylhexosaminidase [Catellatospora sp. TT07R-123]|uniref:glycoside hydrolase family 3 protein n=1 Tax=Catellatospora sp. TT07R-123 TaxID=2733863 RepID=UPI001B1FF715|nr:beta-N-acetylhexosaminidase [Catellatospora sp. TT07R-123]
MQDPADLSAKVAAIVKHMSDEDLAGQVLMPYAYGRSATDVAPGTATGNRALAGVDTPAQMVQKFRLGGIILIGFGGADPTSANQPVNNVENPAQVRALTTGLQNAAAGLTADVPLLIGTDQEFGVVTRLTTGVTMLPSAMAFGAAGNPGLTETAWRAAGAELAAVGVNVDFAPVADVLGPAGSAVIGSRSFGSDPRAAGEQVAAAVRGLRAGGVAATLKHFPGHGHTTADSHTDLPVLKQTRQLLDSDDLTSFKAGIRAGAPLIMAGHLDVQSIDPGVAATFSHKVLTDLLRGELKYDGVVVTDGMNMAPAMKFSPGDAAVKALLAGNDLILMTPNVAAAHKGIVDAIRAGVLPRARIVEAVSRILKLKLGLDREAPALSSVGTHGQQVAPAAAAAITLLRGACGQPLVTGPVRVTAAKGRDKAKARLTAALKAAGVTVVETGGSVVHLVGYGDAKADLNTEAAVTVAMDTPYLLGQSNAKALVATYSSSDLSMDALAQVLAGKAKPTGRAPVEVAGLPRTTCA